MAAKKKKGTRQSTFNKRRKGLLSVLIPWMHRFGVGLSVFVGVAWLFSWFYLSGAMGRSAEWIQNEFEMATADMGFAIEDILVKGRQYTDSQTLLAIVNIEKGDPLFSFDPQEAQELISKISWVESVQVERRWPDTIYIGIKEHEPMVLLKTEKRLKLLDQRGEVIVTNKLERFSDLVMVSGTGAAETAAALIGDLKAEPEVYNRTEMANRLGDRRWDLRLNNGITVKLPEEDVGFALRRLVEAQEKDGLLDKDIKSLDMRETDRISLRTKPGKVQEYKTDYKSEASQQEKAGNNI